MPKIISRQPGWLARSSPAYSLFDGVRSPQITGEHQSSAGKLEAPGLRTLAYRESEVFIADGNTIRWGDLASMKADWEASREEEQNYRLDNNDLLANSQFRILEFKYIAEPIVQLSVSPNKVLLAIATAHTVHICVIPNSRYLSEPDHGPINPKTIMVGNTIHVLSSSRITSVMWHPFGVGGNCLVTITADAVVRLWELNLQDRSTAERPTTAIDLRKLRNATSTSDDILPPRLGISEGISYDSLGMEVARACFGGSGGDQELGWAGMTLWIAMTEGDVYALCPLLPTKWQAYPSVLPNLATTILAGKDQQEDEFADADFLAQYQWLSEQESMPAMEAPRQNEFQQRSWIYTRPESFGAVPKLQGPFSILPGDLEFELALADIHVIAPRLKARDQDGEGYHGMPVSIVCLLTQLASVYICAELDGIHGQWLSETASSGDELDDCNVPELVVLDAVDTFKRSDDNLSSLAGWPTLSTDAISPYAFYVTHSKGVWYISAELWIEGIESEMSLTTTAGTGFRIGVGVEGSKIQRQKLISLLEREEDQPPAPLILHDSDLGHLILTVYEGTPQVAVLDSPSTLLDNTTTSEPQIKQEPEDTIDTSIQVPLRAAYAPSKIFRQDLGSLKERLRKPTGVNTKLNRVSMNETIRLSPAILELMTHDHRILSEETHKLGLAIADLFARCNMMQSEFKSQINRVKEVAGRLDHLNGDYDDNVDDQSSPTRGITGGKNLHHRLEAAKDRQAKLHRRFDELRKQTGSMERPLSDREKSWIGEVNRLKRDVPVENDETDVTVGDDQNETSSVRPPVSRQDARYLKRYKDVQNLVQQLSSQVDSILEDHKSSSEDVEPARSTSPANSTTSFSTSRGLRVPPDIRKQKMASLENSMERQTALLDATLARLEKLGIEW